MGRFRVLLTHLYSFAASFNSLPTLCPLIAALILILPSVLLAADAIVYEPAGKFPLLPA
ncbi:MAG: hypothetical protein JWN70_6064, partial [Planctomycetaceae bacterium]|nr:hypothetical protein [Planctomycetaceae bacterium]